MLGLIKQVSILVPTHLLKTNIVIFVLQNYVSQQFCQCVYVSEAEDIEDEAGEIVSARGET